MSVKYDQLSEADKTLLNTEFPEEIEKQAAAEVAKAQDLYASGFQKLAAESADAMDKAEEEEEEEEKKKPEHKLDEEEKKEASVRGAFIAKGYIEGLMKLGTDRHGDQNHYLYPFIAEKLANAGMEAGKVSSFLEKLRAGAGKAKGMASHGKEKAMAGASKMKGYLKEHRGKAGLGAGLVAGAAAGRASKK